MTVLGASVSPPLDPDRVGELPSCIITLRRVKKVINEYVDNLKALEQKELSDIFTDTSVLEDHSSQWYGFTQERIATRVRWLNYSFVPAIDRDLRKMEILLHSFSNYWDQEIGARISDEGKVCIGNLTKVWEIIEWSLKNQDSKEPYRVEAFAEWKSLLGSLKGAVSEMSSRAEQYWRDSGYHLVQYHDWFIHKSPTYSLEIPTTRDSSPDISDCQISLSDSLDRDAEKGFLEHHDRDSTFSNSLRKTFLTRKRRHKGFLVKEVWLVAVCVFTAVIYSAVTHDVQTAFTIAGVLVASGNVLLLAIAYKNTTTKIALE